MNRMKIVFTAASVAIIATSALALEQEDGPPDAQPGRCYTRCFVPDKYETTTEDVEVRPPSTRIETVPAVYEWVEEKVLEREASKRIEVVPATYKKVSEQVVLREASTKLVPVPAVYGKETEQVEISPASTRWVTKKGGLACRSKDPRDCETRCLEEVPARYRTVTKTVVKSPATTKEIEIPAVYGTATRTVVDAPATTREIEIPAVYRTQRKQVLKAAASSNEVTIPGERQTVTRKKLVQKGGFSQWEEAPCEDRMTTAKIRRIQEALKDKGYDPGPIDDVLGAQTKEALKKFQQAEGLPIGGLNLKTLAALGVEG